MQLTEHWLEMSDRKHRYGSNLKEHERAQYAVEVIDGLLYYRHSGRLVHTLPTSIQADDDVDISQILPDADANDDEETRLEKKRIRNKAKYIYVTDPQGILYVAQKVKGQFHHSSFLGGGTVCAAGGIIVNRGRLIKINP
ncbi:hypothetical protein BGZ92_006976, partial [Podila epicladia]